MDDAADLCERAIRDRRIADVAFDELDLRREIRGLVAVHLPVQGVEHDDLVAVSKQPRH